ncbi:hypothetical protein L7F22_049417 [Adiantum nelumboides]|nr:hypothetical protein [Adiantum nelumboides]
MTSQRPSGRRSVCPRCRSPCTALHDDGRAQRGHLVVDGADRGHVRGEYRHLVGDLGAPPGPVRRQLARVGLGGTELGAQCDVHVGERLTERAGVAGEVGPVADRRGRPLPAVVRARRELLQQREGGGPAVEDTLDPALQRRDRRRPGRAQRPVQLQRQVRARLGHERQVTDGRALGDQPQQQRGDAPVVQAVVEDLPVVVADRGGSGRGVRGAGQEQLVVPVRTVGEGHREDQHLEPGDALAGGQRVPRRDGDAGQWTPLLGEPATPGQPVTQQARERRQVLGSSGRPHASSPSCRASARPVNTTAGRSRPPPAPRPGTGRCHPGPQAKTLTGTGRPGRVRRSGGRYCPCRIDHPLVTGGDHASVRHPVPGNPYWTWCPRSRRPTSPDGPGDPGPDRTGRSARRRRTGARRGRARPGATGRELRRVLPRGASAHAASPRPGAVHGAAPVGVAGRPGVGGEPGLRVVAAVPVDARPRRRAGPPVLRAGLDVAEPLRQPRPAPRGRDGVGVVHRLPDLADHRLRRVVPGGARQLRAVAGVRDDRHRGRPHRAGEEGGRTLGLAAHPERRRPLRPDLQRARPGLRHRGRVPRDVRHRHLVRRHDHRRHRPRPHRQGRGLPARRARLRRLPRHLPHGRDRAGRLGDAAGRAAGEGLGQPRRRHRGEAGEGRLHRRPAAAGDLLPRGRQGDELDGDPAGHRRRRRRAALGVPALLQGRPAVGQLAGPDLRGHADGDRRRAALAGRPRLRCAAPGRQRLPRGGEVGRRDPRLVRGPPAVGGREPPHREHGAQGRRVHLPGAEPDHRRHPGHLRGGRRPVLRLRQPPRLPPRARHRRHRVPAPDAAHLAGAGRRPGLAGARAAEPRRADLRARALDRDRGPLRVPRRGDHRRRPGRHDPPRPVPAPHRTGRALQPDLHDERHRLHHGHRHRRGAGHHRARRDRAGRRRADPAGAPAAGHVQRVPARGVRAVGLGPAGHADAAAGLGLGPAELRGHPVDLAAGARPDGAPAGRRAVLVGDAPRAQPLRVAARPADRGDQLRPPDAGDPGRAQALRGGDGPSGRRAGRVAPRPAGDGAPARRRPDQRDRPELRRRAGGRVRAVRAPGAGRDGHRPVLRRDRRHRRRPQRVPDRDGPVPGDRRGPGAPGGRRRRGLSVHTRPPPSTPVATGVDARQGPHEVVLAPAVGLARHLVVHLDDVGVPQPQCRHVQLQGALLRGRRVQRADHEHLVTGGRVQLRVRDDVRVVHLVEVELAQLLQRGVRAPDLVELGEVRLERAALVERGVEVARAQLVLLRVQVLLAARLDRGALVELEAGVDAPGGRHRRGQRRPDREHSRAAGLQRLVEDVRGVGEHVRTALVGVLGVQGPELEQLLLLGPPREVRVGLGEAQPCQAEQPRRAGERLGQEQHLRVGPLDLPDQPVPEVRRLGVRVVDPEDLHPVLDPVQDDAQALGVDAGRVAVEVDRVDVLVLLRRVLRVGDRPVRAHGEPLRVLGDPGVVGRALQRQVERDLHAELVRPRDERVEVVEVAQLRVDRVVPARGGADRPRRADVARLGVDGVVAALAVHRADRVDRRQVDDVEAHLRDAVELLRRGDERAVHGAAGLVAAAGGAGEELVPGAVQRAGPVDEDRPLRAAGDQLPDGTLDHDRDDGVEQGGGDPRAQRQRGVPQRVRGAEQQVAAVLLGRATPHPGEQPGADLEVVGQLLGRLARGDLLLHARAPGRPRVAPRVDAEGPATLGVGADPGHEAVGAHPVGLHPHVLRVARRPVGRQRGEHDVRRDGVVSLPPHGRPDRDDLADHGLGRVSALHERGHVVDSEPTGHRLHPQEIVTVGRSPTRVETASLTPPRHLSPHPRDHRRERIGTDVDGTDSTCTDPPVPRQCDPTGGTPSRPGGTPRACRVPGYPRGRESPPPFHRPCPAPRSARAAADTGDEPAVDLARADPGPVRLPRPRRLGRERAGPGPPARRDPHRAAGRARRGRPGRRRGRRAGRGAGDLPVRAALVRRGRRRRQAVCRRLLLDGVRRLGGAAQLLRRSRRARRRPPQGRLGPGRPADRRRAAVPVGLLPPVPVARRLAARALPGARPAGTAAAAAHRRVRRAGARRGRDAGGPHAARADLAGGGRAGPAAAARLRHRGERPDLRGVTDRLYGGDQDHRIRQEILIGVGGVRAVRAFCRVTGHPTPEVFHTNEGHAGFLGFERIRELCTGSAVSSNGAGPATASASSGGLDFDEALAAVRAGTVFTTHTPVPAGIDRFGLDLVRHYLTDRLLPGLPTDRLLALGAEEDPETFNMAHMGLRLAQRANGVSRLHGAVSRGMFGGMWAGFDTDEVPIGSVTNGVHGHTWEAHQVTELLGEPGSSTAEVSDADVWGLRNTLRSRLVDEVRRRVRAAWLERGASEPELGWTDHVFDRDVLTVGFARRVPTYKRLTLMLRDPDRLRSLLLDPHRPVQLVVAGKSHPADDGGKALIQQIVRFADDPDVRHRIVFLPDYDMSMARYLYWGCDVWLNNPLRPLEACGTSGMKSALNGGLNLSIRDGWWDEFYDGANGWAIPTADGVEDPTRRDDLEANALYELIATQVGPAFYDRTDGVPHRWVELVRHTLTTLRPQVQATRMVREYVQDWYAPAARAAADAAASDYAVARDIAQFRARLNKAWNHVRITGVDASGLPDTPVVGSPMTVRATVDLAGLDPSDVTVEAVVGRVDSSDELADPVTVAMEHRGDGSWEVAVPLPHAGLTGAAWSGSWCAHPAGRRWSARAPAVPGAARRPRCPGWWRSRRRCPTRAPGRPSRACRAGDVRVDRGLAVGAHVHGAVGGAGRGDRHREGARGLLAERGEDGGPRLGPALVDVAGHRAHRHRERREAVVAVHRGAGGGLGRGGVEDGARVVADLDVVVGAQGALVPDGR